MAGCTVRSTSGHAARRTALALLLVASIPRASAAAEGNLLGWVEDARGIPVSGVLISAFAKGMRDGGFVTFSDTAGRFFLTAVPPGAYTVRAVVRGHKPAPARQVTVVADQDSIFSITLKTLGDLTDADVESRARELQWLERHKRRSVLEDHDGDPQPQRADVQPQTADLASSLSPWLSNMSGTLELVASSAGAAVPTDASTADGLPTGSGVVRLKGHMGELASFDLGGLVAENGSRSWRMAGEFVLQPRTGHAIRAGAGYGTRLLRSPSMTDEDTQGVGVGAVFAEDRWSLGDRLALTAGLRHTYVGFASDRNHTDPMASVEFGPGPSTRVRGTFAARTLAPGGDMFSLSSLTATAAPAISYAATDSHIRAERTLRYELAVEQSVGGTRVSARTFREDTRDQLINAFSPDGAGESLRIFNNGFGLVAHGAGVEVSRSLGGVLRGTLSYAYGHSRSDAPEAGSFMANGGLPAFRQAAFHDLTAQLETVFERSGTRIVAYYRVNSSRPREVDGVGLPVRTARFDVRLSQGLPFMGTLTGADWDLLFAFRNLFYEPTDGGILDEVSVVNPPKRVSGGISVRF